MNIAPLIRVSRKRCADPHEALIVQIKKIKQADPVVFTFLKTKDVDGDDEDFNGAPVIDYLANPDKSESMEEDPGESSNPLEFVRDEAIGEVGENLTPKVVEPQVMLNGQVLVPVKDDDIVFDYYRANPGNDQNVEFYSNQFLESAAISDETFDVRFASRYEAELVNNESDDSDAPADDYDDSNDEDNWRNDYPDEDSYDEDDDNDDFYGELRNEEWHHADRDFPEGIQRRLENCTIGDTYESYLEGDETTDEEDI